MFAGSILDLEPNTAYEARFVLRDPDGAKGATTKTVTVRTRPEPMPAQGGSVYHVYPPGFKGTKAEPSFDCRQTDGTELDIATLLELGNDYWNGKK